MMWKSGRIAELQRTLWRFRHDVGGSGVLAPRCKRLRRVVTKSDGDRKLTKESQMKQWKRPVIVEIQVGMEINLYVCAEL